MTLAFPSRAATLSAAADTILKGDKPKLDWKPIEIETMPRELGQLYANYKEAQRIASEHRQAFEDACCGPVAKLLNAKPGQDVAFGYRFGQLSVALTDKRVTSTRANALRF